MPKSQCPKIKGVIRNVLINADDICKEVPRVMDNNDVVQVRCTMVQIVQMVRNREKHHI